MIALLLAAQLAAQPLVSEQVQVLPLPQIRSSELVRSLRRKGACGANPGRMEVSLATPAALYRQGDRPAKGLKKWADYPDGTLCVVGDER